MIDAQPAVLAEVVRRVAQLGASGSAARPAVVIDLDLCGLVPRRRAVRATRLISGSRPGAPNGIAELSWPAALPGLPSYATPAWTRFLAVTGLRDRYPAVRWPAVHAEFCTAFFRPWHQLRTDEVAPGLVAFVGAVERAGGAVIFNTARRDRVREHTEPVLAAHGLGHVPLLTQPDRRTASIEEHKVDALRRLGPAPVVAIFDDLTANRRAFAARYPDALVIAVELAGFISDREAAGPPPDGAPLVASFTLAGERPA